MNNPFRYFKYGKSYSEALYKMTWTQIVLTVGYGVYDALYSLLTKYWARIILNLWGAEIGNNLVVNGFLVLQPFGKICIGDNVTINSRAIHVGGSNRKTAFRIGRAGSLTMKNGVGMSNTTVHCFKSITICENVLIGGGCELMDTDFHPTNTFDRIMRKRSAESVPIIVGRNAFIGGNSIIKKGVTIGEGAVVATGSLVVKNIPPYEIWGGVPAKFIKTIEKTNATD